MRVLVLALFLAFSVPVYGHADGEDLFTITQQIDSSAEVLQSRAHALAESRGFLDDDVMPAAFPATLSGDVFLRIEGVSFTLYLRAANSLTEVELASRQLNVSDEVKEQAKAFLNELSGRRTLDQR